MQNLLNRSVKILSILSYCLLIAFPVAASAATATLEWIKTDSDALYYRLFQRTRNEAYTYSNWIYSGSDTSFTVQNLQDGVAYFFVVRAYSDVAESADSNEIEFFSDDSSPSSDSDGDGVVDELDAFPNDPNEWIDTDEDGTGNNADLDDDDDGMPDSWETENGLDPLRDDSQEDADGDGISNIDEFENGSNPSQAPGNQTPFAPALSEPADAAIVGLTPALVTLNYVDPDGDAHARTCFQIALNSDFSMLVLDQTLSKDRLTSFDVPELILDTDTTYFWRARFIDSRNGHSDWSRAGTFTTHDAMDAGDADGNGLLDTQEVGLGVDLDGDGTPDALQDGLMCVGTNDHYNPYIALKQVSGDARVVAMRALTLNGLGLASTQPRYMTGLISFKLLLEPGVTTVSISVLFSQPAPENAEWYKFNSDEGWQSYPHVTFSADRKTMTILLEDGGAGDQDGVRNGVIVDPSGLGYERLLSNGSSSTYTDQTACFVSTALRNIESQKSHSLVLMLLVAIGGVVCGVIERRSNAKR